MELSKQRFVMGASLPCAFFLLIICTNSVITAETHHKRSLQGFQGVRSKRSIEEVNTQDKQEGFENNHQILVATTTEQNFLDNEVRGPELLRDLPPLSVVKRAPMGFMGMRGKKQYEYTDMDKKALQGFHGVRGKKILVKNPYRLAPKRAPSGFMGMRGKKRLLLDEYDTFKRAPSGFMGMRGKKRFLVNDYGANKRAPSGFMGMRGKKEYLDPLYSSSATSESVEDNGISDFAQELYEALQDERRLLNEYGQMYGLDTQLPNEFDSEQNYNKLTPWGLHAPMDMETSSEDDEEQATEVGYGMSAHQASSSENPNLVEKRDTADEISGEKRAPNSGFYGMRGKKAPLSTGFFGTRGKKGPFEFRGKFVGVRGKKIPEGSLRRLAMELSELHPELQSSALMGQDSNKRAPSGFGGLRGKKWTDSSNEE